MLESALDEDLLDELKGGTVRVNSDGRSVESSNYHWKNAFIAPFSSIPNKISETIWSSRGSKDEPSIPPLSTTPSTLTTAPSITTGTITTTSSTLTTTGVTTTTTRQVESNEKCLQPLTSIFENSNNYFTFRDGVVEKAVQECSEHFLDENEGQVLHWYLITQINHWDTDKERLILLTAKNMILVKYDFIALRRLGCRKFQYTDIEGICIGNLIYPSGSLIPKMNGFADGISNLLENCFFKKQTSKSDNHSDIENLNTNRERNMKGIRLLLKQEKSENSNFVSKWNPFNNDVPFLTFTYHPIYFHKDCTEEKIRNIYNLDLLMENICILVEKWKENILILNHNILLENYFGIGSVIHNRNSLGFFKVRGKFSY